MCVCVCVFKASRGVGGGSSRGAVEMKVAGLMKASVSSPRSDQPAVRDQAAQAANYSNYDSLLAEINLIKRRLSRAR